MFIAMDPPKHDVQRKTVSGVVAPRNLAVLQHTIRERVRIKGEIQTLTAQGRLTGYILSGLPIILTLVLFAISRDYMEQLFVGPPWIIQGVIPCGWPILALGLIMIAIGAAVVRRIVDIDV